MIHIAEAPEALFRQAMAAALTPEGENEARTQLHSLMGDLLARRDLERSQRLQNMLLACRLRLRALQNIVLCAREEEDFLPCLCELREYTQDLCAAANTLLTPLGRQVRFEAPEERMEAFCAPRDIAWLVLELVCNCALHCPGEEIAVSLRPPAASPPRPRGKKRPRAYTLTVECDGPLDLEALHTAGLREGSGVAAMRRIAWLHHGALLWLERDDKSVAALRLGGWHPATGITGAYDPPDYVELLGDPCSPVYIALAPAVGSL